MPPIAVEIVAILLLILLNGAFALSEMAVVSARKARLEQRANAGDRRARAALELANEPNQFLSTIQVGITLVGILTGAFGGARLAGPLAAQLQRVPALAPYSEPLALSSVVLASTYLSLIVGELVPKRLALNSPERSAAAVAIPMRALARLAAPLVALLGASTDLVLRLLGQRPAAEAPVTEEEVKILIEQGTRAGVFEAAEQEIVESVFRLGDRRVSSLMTPRPEIAWLDLEGAPERIRRAIVEHEHSRFPVGRGGLDEVVGIALAKDILAPAPPDRPLDLEALVRPALFVPESMPAFRALETFKRSGCQIALVVDEYGSVQGLVTIIDLLEALVGDIPSPAELAEPPALRRPDGSWLLDGTLPFEDAKEMLGLGELPGEGSGDYHTVGGLMMRQAGRIPGVGDGFEWEGLRFEVVDMDGNRVDKVLVAPISPGRSDRREGNRD
jgi:putative hemolysin